MKNKVIMNNVIISRIHPSLLSGDILMYICYSNYSRKAENCDHVDTCFDSTVTFLKFKKTT